MTLSEGQLLHGRYRIEHLAGRGGYGAVYKAFDATLNRPCAVKENLIFGEHAERQFEREAHLLARLHHPNLPRVVDYFLLPSKGQYLVMDFVEGRNLQNILRHRLRPFSQEEALAIIEQVCAALAYLHRQSPPILHRDVKPQNIIITPVGTAMLVDFGVSKVVYGSDVSMSSGRGISPGFAAPEQYGPQPTDERSDIYSVGATLYAMLTGQPPADAWQRLSKKTPLAPIRQSNGSVSAGVEQVICRALALPAEQRFSSIDQFHTALCSAHGVGRRGGRWRNPGQAGLAIGVMVLGVLLFAALLRLLPVVAPVSSGAAGTPTAIAAGAQAPTASPGPTATPVATVPTVTAVATVPTVTAVATVPTVTATPTPQPTSTTAATATPPAALATPLGGGGRILFVLGSQGSRELYTMLPSGANITNQTNDVADDWVGSLSLDDRLLAFASNRNDNWDIYVKDLETKGISRLTDDPAEDHDPAWSPDGSRLLFHSNRSDGIWRIFTMAANGDDVSVLTKHHNNGAWAGAWSPDGSKIAYTVNHPSPGDIYVMNADGSNPQNLTNSSAHESTAHWSPDGSRIAFYSERDGNYEIYVMNADGSSLQRLTDDPATDWLPTWSPDGTQIVFASNRQGVQGLYRLDLATGVVTPYTGLPEEAGSPIWAP